MSQGKANQPTAREEVTKKCCNYSETSGAPREEFAANGTPMVMSWSWLRPIDTFSRVRIS